MTPCPGHREMIIVNLGDPSLCSAACEAAHAEEDVILNPFLALEAIEFGYPRLVIQAAPDDSPGPYLALGANIPTLVITRASIEHWDAEWQGRVPAVSRVTFLAGRLRSLIEREAPWGSWVDRALAELEQMAGVPLAAGLRALGRRVLEFPSHYDHLAPLAASCGVSSGALKARFRRRDLPSPYTYLRWFRMIAAAYVLSDRGVTVAKAALKLGFTSDGNLCRAMRALTGMTPTEARTLQGWTRLLVEFAWTHVRSDPHDAWSDLEDLFVRRVA